MEFFQLPKHRLNDVRILHSSWILLKELQQVNEDEWNACFTSVLHQFLTLYLRNGPTALEKMPTKPLFKLFSRPPLAKAFLESITVSPEFQGNSIKNALVAAFQIFELAYRKYPMIIINCCLSKLVDGHSDAVFLRLECLSLVAKMQNLKRAGSNGEPYTHFTWSSGVVENLKTTILYDTSVRVRRSALHVLLQAYPDDRELLDILLLKIRDHDEKVRFLAFQKLVTFPMEVLVANVKSCDWQLVFKQGLFDETNGTYHLAEDFLVKYLMTDAIAESPSSRLKKLGFLERSNYEMYSKAIEKHINIIFERERELLLMRLLRIWKQT